MSKEESGNRFFFAKNREGGTLSVKANSFSIAKEYVDYLNIPAVSESFRTLEYEQWNDALEEYLSAEHKG